jgi:hypothetical protein
MTTAADADIVQHPQHEDLALGAGFARPPEIKPPDDKPREWNRSTAPWKKGIPQLEGQATNPDYANTVKTGPDVTDVFDLLNPAHVKQLNRLNAKAFKQAIRLKMLPTYQLHNRLVCVAVWCDLFYQHIVPPATHEPQKRYKRRKPAP